MSRWDLIAVFNATVFFFISLRLLQHTAAVAMWQAIVFGIVVGVFCIPQSDRYGVLIASVAIIAMVPVQWLITHFKSR